MTDADETRAQLDLAKADLSTGIGVIGSLEGIVDNLVMTLSPLIVGTSNLDRAHTMRQVLQRTQHELAVIRQRFQRIDAGIEEWRAEV